MPPQTLQQWTIARLSNTKGLGNSRNDQVRIANRSQRHETYSIGKHVHQLCCHLDTQTSFPNAARANECKQTYLWAQQKSTNIPHLLLTPNQRRERYRQVIYGYWSRLDCLLQGKSEYSSLHSRPFSIE